MHPSGELMQTFVRVRHSFYRQYWRIVKPRRFGVKVAIQSPDSSEFLLVQHSYDQQDVFTFPGGGYSPKKETPEQAGAREIKEELGLVIGRIGVLGNYTSTLEGKRDTITCLHGIVEKGELNLNAEIADTIWVSGEELQDTRLTNAGREMVQFLRDDEIL